MPHEPRATDEQARALRDSLTRLLSDKISQQLPAARPISSAVPESVDSSADTSSESLPSPDAVRIASTVTRTITSSDRPTTASTTRPKTRAEGRSVSFSLEMARALHQGRKTVTRRVVRPQPTTRPDPAACPLARVGDALWVREPFVDVAGEFFYAADADAPPGLRFRPGMYMPRRASRATLRVASISVGRVHDINDQDIAAEGCPPDTLLPLTWFSHLWDTYHIDRGIRWGDNPWVWVIGFVLER